jgi:UDP-N-acetylmuramoylalanine--D-glutamate ligase
VHLIAGGRGKGESFRQLAEAAGPNVLRVYALGETANEIVAAFGSRAVAVADLAAAVEQAAAAANEGDVVLLSPACASYDQYSNFEERGDHFRRLVEALR